MLLGAWIYLALAACGDPLETRGNLKATVIVARHGIKNPLKEDIGELLSWKQIDFGCPYGTLTKHGMYVMQNLGHFLDSIYGKHAKSQRRIVVANDKGGHHGHSKKKEKKYKKNKKKKKKKENRGEGDYHHDGDDDCDGPNVVIFSDPTSRRDTQSAISLMKGMQPSCGYILVNRTDPEGLLDRMENDDPTGRDSECGMPVRHLKNAIAKPELESLYSRLVPKLCSALLGSSSTQSCPVRWDNMMPAVRCSANSSG
mmetsp:Transcript_16478/g.31124  ORF Transcript_16478/g.31124 Transcript_16478/m.31124 type:complete len:256 (+) Transcript_16478:95-862(+)